MEFTARSICLKDGAPALLKSPLPKDAAEMLRYKVQMSAETEYVGRYPEEITETLAEEELSLGETLASPDSMLISIFIDGKIAANAGILPVSRRAKLRHRAEFCIAVLKPWWNMGAGGLLLQECLSAAQSMGYESVELSASAENSAALALYAKHGFVEYGRLERAYRLKSGGYDDSVLMTKRLPRNIPV